MKDSDDQIRFKLSRDKADRPKVYIVWLQSGHNTYFICSHAKKAVADKLAHLSCVRSGRNYYVS